MADSLRVAATSIHRVAHGRSNPLAAIARMERGDVIEQRRMRVRVALAALIATFVWAVLVWEHLHGGVVSHSVLARDDLPGISNSWGGVLMPVLAWFLIGRIQRRTRRHHGNAASSSPEAVVAGFAGAAVFGILLSVFFSTGQERLTSHMATALLPLALLFPIYRAEYVLGFVVAMTFTFGAVLPTVFACVVASVAALMYRYVRPLLLGVAGWMKRKWWPAARGVEIP